MSEFQEEFVVKDDSAAEWCMRKIREAEEDRAKWKNHYEEQMQKVNDSADRTVAYFTAKLEDYFANVPHKTTRTQESYTLPTGKLVRKKQQPEVSVDNDELVPWLEQNFMGQLVKVKKTADWAGLKKVVTITGCCVTNDDGEVIPGIAVTERPDVFKVEVSE